MYVYTITLRDDVQGFAKQVAIRSNDVWRAVEGAFDELETKGYDPDRFSVIELKRGRQVSA